MILLANFLQAVARILHLLLMVSVWIFIIRVILSWIPLPSASPLTGLLYGLTEPVLRRIRRFLPPYKTAGFDLSPMIAVIFLLFIDSFLVKSLSLYAAQMLHRNTWPL
ncbi:MAG: YggT family protein [Acidobacteria bacterium]|nr:YggT family protein [Acidobacteriota bacterium]MCG2815582.1 YggT family protein [Candidatus Aminicenantes bacterium]MBU1338714.1 YggT family protein [Acidobacteriota bacterium]MBU1475230.1 YggT family protein [Acidobacteriota bacterium]MBU2438131.1 YggT family protein [Acidobacteriota bacterium]